MNRILVTGGLGFIGSNLTKQLLTENNEVWVVDDYSNSDLDPEAHFGVETRTVAAPLSKYYDWCQDPKKPALVFLEADCNNKALLERVESGYFDKIFHMAAHPRVEWTVLHPIESIDENFTKSIKLAYSAAKGDTKFIFSSTAAVYGDVFVLPVSEIYNQPAPLSPYGLSKLTTENHLRLFEKLYNLDWVSLRYFNVYGPGQDGNSPYSTAVSAWCHKARMKLPLRSDGDGEQTRDMVHVRDVVAANVMLSKIDYTEIERRVYNVGSGTSISNNEILEKFIEKGYTDIIQAPARVGDIKHLLADIREIQKLGWEPKINFETGLEETLKYWGL